MQIKRSMGMACVLFISLFMLSGVAFAAPVVPSALPATEQLSFDPLVYLTLLLAVLTFSSIGVSVFFFARYKKQSKLICCCTECPDHPAKLWRHEEQGYEDGFDYRLIETPQELAASHSKQSDMAVEAAINRLVSNRPPHIAKHKRQLLAKEALKLHIKLVANMKHARKHNSVVAAVPASSLPLSTVAPVVPLLEVPEELEHVLRKIG